MADEPKPATPAASATPAAATEVRYVDANVEQIAAQYGGKDQAIRRLFKDAKRAREGKRTAEKKVEELTEAAKQKPGTVVLSADDAKLWEGFKALGKTPDEVKTTLASHGELSVKVAKVERKETAATAANSVDTKGNPLKWNADALAQLAEDKGLTLVIKKEKLNERDVDVAYVQPKEQGAAPVKLTDYVGQHLKTYEPMLLAAGTEGAGGAADSARRTPFVEQSGGRENNTQVTPANGLPLREARVLPSQRNAATKP